MSLTPDAFDEMNSARKRWERKGLSYREARERLASLDTTVYPIAVHVASFISDNFTPELWCRAH